MLPAPVIPPAQGLQAAFDLFELGMAIKRGQLAARSPRAKASTLEKKLNAWLASQPLPTMPGLVQRPVPLRWRPQVKARTNCSGTEV